MKNEKYEELARDVKTVSDRQGKITERRWQGQRD